MFVLICMRCEVGRRNMEIKEPRRPTAVIAEGLLLAFGGVTIYLIGKKEISRFLPN